MKIIYYEKNLTILPNKTVWIIRFDNFFTPNFTLLISKISEALLPNTIGNHIGEGGTFEHFLKEQKNVRFIINGGFNHYRKNFYNWPHQNFNIGDPVGVAKIREHYYEDFLDIENYGFFVQENKNMPWKIIKFNELDKNSKYILGCTPLLIYQGKAQILPFNKMIPLNKETINPPSFLGHGMESHQRTAVGIKNNELYFILVESNSIENEDGCTLLELQSIGLQLALDSFLNLDGGGSSQFRLWNPSTKSWITNSVAEKDKNRILGHAIVLFDDELNY